MKLTAERLREVLDYDPETGVFRWRITISRTRAGAVAGNVKPDGRRYICIDGRRYAAHRLAWFYVHGLWPTNEIDHKNVANNDNRFSNLRDVTHSENMQNRQRAGRNNKTGLLGVSRSRGRFQATIEANGKSHHLGRFDTADLAHAAYIKAKRELHPAGRL